MFVRDLQEKYEVSLFPGNGKTNSLTRAQHPYARLSDHFGPLISLHKAQKLYSK